MEERKRHKLPVGIIPDMLEAERIKIEERAGASTLSIEEIVSLNELGLFLWLYCSPDVQPDKRESSTKDP